MRFLITCLLFNLNCGIDLCALQAKCGGENITPVDMSVEPITIDLSVPDRIGCWNPALAIPVRSGLVTFCPGTFFGNTGSNATLQCNPGWHICTRNEITDNECKMIPGVGVANSAMTVSSTNKTATCGNTNGLNMSWAACGKCPSGSKSCYNQITPCNGFYQFIDCQAAQSDWQCLTNPLLDIKTLTNNVPSNGVWCCNNQIG